MNNPYNQYKQQSVLTMTAGEIVVKLLDEAIKHSNRVIYFIDNNSMPEANEAIVRVQQIIYMLMTSLDMQYEVSKGLSQLYDFFNYQLVQSNLKKNSSFVKDIVPMITELRDSFTMAEKTVKASSR